jgi:hypothetical protein
MTAVQVFEGDGVMPEGSFQDGTWARRVQDWATARFDEQFRFKPADLPHHMWESPLIYELSTVRSDPHHVRKLRKLIWDDESIWVEFGKVYDDPTWERIRWNTTLVGFIDELNQIFRDMTLILDREAGEATP